MHHSPGRAVEIFPSAIPPRQWIGAQESGRGKDNGARRERIPGAALHISWCTGSDGGNGRMAVHVPWCTSSKWCTDGGQMAAHGWNLVHKRMAGRRGSCTRLLCGAPWGDIGAILVHPLGTHLAGIWCTRSLNHGAHGGGSPPPNGAQIGGGGEGMVHRCLQRVAKGGGCVHTLRLLAVS